MGILNFFKKKKEDDFESNLADLESGLGLDELNNTGLEDSEFSNNSKATSMPTTPNDLFKSTNTEEDAFNPSAYGPDDKYKQQGNGQTEDKTNELILAKLDSIRSELTNVHHRLDKIEDKLQQKRW